MIFDHICWCLFTCCWYLSICVDICWHLFILLRFVYICSYVLIIVYICWYLFISVYVVLTFLHMCWDLFIFVHTCWYLFVFVDWPHSRKITIIAFLYAYPYVLYYIILIFIDLRFMFDGFLFLALLGWQIWAAMWCFSHSFHIARIQQEGNGPICRGQARSVDVFIFVAMIFAQVQVAARSWY